MFTVRQRVAAMRAMTLGDLIDARHVLLRRAPADLDEAVAQCLHALGRDDIDVGAVKAALSDRLSAVRANEQAIVVAVSDDVDEPQVAVLTATTPFPAPLPAPDAVARSVILFRVPGALRTLKVQWFPAVIRALREEGVTDALLRAERPDEVAHIASLVQVPLRRQLLVEDAMDPLSLRVYGDTPVSEVVDLIVRRGVPSVPVVGEDHELLGVIGARDALRELLPDRMARGDEERDLEARSARDLMNRAVMCVSEGQSLLEAAHLMVKRDVEQLPVVREGRLVGFVHRDKLLKTLHES